MGPVAGLGQTGAEAPIEEHSRKRGSQLNGFSTCWLRERRAEVLIHIRGFEVDVFAAEWDRLTVGVDDGAADMLDHDPFAGGGREVPHARKRRRARDEVEDFGTATELLNG
jgi:hypothetical protein